MPHVLPRLVPSTLVTDCYCALKEAILNLDLPPGAPLVEATIAAQLGISKTPVREALAQLAGEGLVVSDGRKSFVAGLTVEDIREIYMVRLMLEPSSLRLVTASLTSDDLRYLDELIDRASCALAEGRLSEFIAASDGFHTYLIERSNNRHLTGIARRLFEHARRVRAAIFRTEEDLAAHVLSERGIENHRRILDALEARDSKRAAEMMEADIQSFLDLYETPVMQAALDRLSYRRPG